MSSSFRRLDADQILATAERLRDRVIERFPTAGLGRVARELLTVAQEARARSASIRRAHRSLRIASALLLAMAAGALALGVAAVHPHIEDGWRMAEVIQTLEALLGSLFFLSAGAVLLVSLEARSKRRRCVAALHELRALAHIIDMHQLTKDPERMPGRQDRDTPSSPRRSTMTRFELTRYLDYCSEMLSLLGKLGALYGQDSVDSQTREAVDDVEDLTTGMSRKIWQKIMILQPRD